MCKEYFLLHHKQELLDVLEAKESFIHYSVYINFLVFLEHQPDTAQKLLKEPETCLQELDDGVLKAQLSLLKDLDLNCQIKHNVHCRIYHLPEFSKMRRYIFPSNNDVDRFLQISGTVMRATAPKLLEYQRSYICVQCKTPVLIRAEYDKNYIIKIPKVCQNSDCQGSNLIHLGELESENCKDYQEIKVQEDVRKLGVGTLPDTMWVTLEDDLVDTCKPGDSVTICGVLKRRWCEFDKGKKINITLALKANHIQVDNNTTSSAVSSPEVKELFDNYWLKYSDNPLEGRDVILKSFCPQLYGLYLVKLAVAVVLAGGCHVASSNSVGIRTRSEAHLLLVGDPGTGKSHLLRFASKIIPRSVLTTGVGSTAAGLTVTAMMERGEWQLEAGALVMADGGICCIDEFNSMKEHDRTSIHEAMEQQSISVAKASIVCKLNTRCSILAACNPKGNLDLGQPLSINIALPSPLLSRFDLVMLLKDDVNEEWDSQVADYILNEGHSSSKLSNSSLWTVDILQSYFARIKKFSPRLSEESEIILSSYYQLQRRMDGRNKARTTVRLLESLVRLSQGHARLMYHEKVEVIDSVYAIVLVDTAMEHESSILSLHLSTNSIFPERPDFHYRTILNVVLEKLQLTDLLKNELSGFKEESNTRRRVDSRFFHNRQMDDKNDIQLTTSSKPDLVEHSGSFNKTSNVSHENDEGYNTVSFDTSVTIEFQNACINEKFASKQNIFYKSVDSTVNISRKKKVLNQPVGESIQEKVSAIREASLVSAKEKEQNEENIKSGCHANSDNEDKNYTSKNDITQNNGILNEQPYTNKGASTSKQFSFKIVEKNIFLGETFTQSCDNNPANYKNKESLNIIEKDILKAEHKVCNSVTVNVDVYEKNKLTNATPSKDDDTVKVPSKKSPKDLLSKFKFVPKDKDPATENAGGKDGMVVARNSSDGGSTKTSSNREQDVCSKRKRATTGQCDSNVSKFVINTSNNSDSGTNKETAKRIRGKGKQIIKKKESDVDPVKSDLEMLKYMPSVRDNFTLDLNFDRDSTSMNTLNSKFSFEQMDDSDLDLDI